jgi:hypothetical protein
MKKIIYLYLSTFLFFVINNTLSATDIIVSQAGFSPYDTKLFYLVSDKKISDTKFLVKNKDGQVVLSGEVSLWGKYYENYYYIGDITLLKTEGEYKVVYQGQESVSFKIKKGLYKSLYSDTINEYFMSQRCGVETKYHKKCHLDDAVTPEKK